MSQIQMLIDNLKSHLSEVKMISNENCLKSFVKKSAKTCFINCTNTKFPFLKNKKCDLKLVTGNKVSWIELKDNITLLPIGSSKIIYDMNKLVFLDIARLIVGVNNQTDNRLIIANTGRAVIDDYYSINHKQILKVQFSAEDVLPVSFDRKKFVELKIEANIEIHFLSFLGGYIIVAQILDGCVEIRVYKDIENIKREGECYRKYYVDYNNDSKENFFKEYFPAS